MSSSQVNGFDRFNDALRSLDDQLQDLRERFDDGRRRVETEIRKRRDQVEADFRKSLLFKRAESAVENVTDSVENTRDQLFGLFRCCHQGRCRQAAAQADQDFQEG